MITAYDPPAFMTDFDRIPGQRAAWSRAVSGWFDESVAAQKYDLDGQPCQYYNQLTTHPSGPAIEQEIVWNGFPGSLRNRLGRSRALAMADHPLPLTQAMDGQPGGYFYGGQWEHLYYRPQDEYCEWRVTRDPDGGIRRVTFTSEPPEYWQALHGDTLAGLNGDPVYPTTGDPKLMHQLYREYVSPDVRYEDLVCAVDLVDDLGSKNPLVVYPKGSYNPYNRWNTTDGIMHLTQPSNSLSAEILLGGDATVLRAAGRSGRTVSDPDALICCAHYGGANRCSDPTIGASVNELAALGCAITLRNPVGLYIDDLDVTGWAGPKGQPVDPAWFRILRGRPGLIERAVFEVPEGAGFRVSDVTIGGVPISVGGQLSEHITVKLVGLAATPGKFSNKPSGCAGGCCADAANPSFLFRSRLDDSCPPDRVPVFVYLSGKPPAAALAPVIRTGRSGRPRFPVNRCR
jgi:hypothetical protein